MKPRKFVSVCLLVTLAVSAVTFAGLSEALAPPSELWTQIMACDDSFVERAYPD